MLWSSARTYLKVLSSYLVSPKYKELSATAQLSLQGVRSSNRTVAVRNKGKGVVEAQHGARNFARALTSQMAHPAPCPAACAVGAS